MDWRLQGQEKYLKGVVLQRKKYQPYRLGWDHDHCEFCGKKFTVKELGSRHAGYTTSDNYHWVCDDCFGDFEKLFAWTVIS